MDDKSQKISQDEYRMNIKNMAVENGLNHLTDCEILELLLFFAINGKDTVPIAHRLIAEFGTIHEVFSADVEKLMAVEGVSESAASLIKLVPHYGAAITKNRHLGRPMLDREELAHLFMALHFGYKHERILLALFDDDMRLLDIMTLGEGDVASVHIDKRVVVTNIINTKATKLILSHNHPNGWARPSLDDIRTTEAFVGFCADYGAELVEHIIVGTDGATLMCANEYFRYRGRIPTERDKQVAMNLLEEQ